MGPETARASQPFNDRNSLTVGMLLRLCRAMEVSAAEIVRRLEEQG